MSSSLLCRTSIIGLIVASLVSSRARADDACAGDACVPSLEPFVDPLPVPKVATPQTGTAGGAATYKLSIVELDQKLHSSLPATRVWGLSDGTTAGAYPGPTIEASVDQTVKVVWKNDLRDKATGALRTTHLLPVDTCLTHGTGSVPRTVIHMHGAHVPAASDGYPEWTQAPGEEVTYEYPNHQESTTLWYHDHAMGLTRLNVYMGVTGFYLLRSPGESALGLPSGEYEIPLAIQDRSFTETGALSYPSTWVEHFEGDKMLVNGKVWPFLDVKKGKYRFRVLNGCNSRVLTLALSDGTSFQQIGSDGGLLPAPVTMTSVMLGPSERADLVFDFSARAANTSVVLRTGMRDVMKFRVVDAPGHTAAIPAALQAVPRIPATEAVITRTLSLSKSVGHCGVGWLIDELPWETITERPKLGTTEIWRFFNQSGMAHPMHIHLVEFQILDRKALGGSALPPPPNEMGWKDTVLVQPYEEVRVIARFEDYAGKYVYHCHILEHEDNMMMRQFETFDPDAAVVDATVSGDAASDVATDATDATDASDAAAVDDAPMSDGTLGDASTDTFVDATVDSTVLDSAPPDAAAAAPADDGGCGCRSMGSASSEAGLGALAMLAAATLRRRKLAR